MAEDSAGIVFGGSLRVRPGGRSFGPIEVSAVLKTRSYVSQLINARNNALTKLMKVCKVEKSRSVTCDPSFVIISSDDYESVYFSSNRLKFFN